MPAEDGATSRLLFVVPFEAMDDGAATYTLVSTLEPSTFMPAIGAVIVGLKLYRRFRPGGARSAARN
jgi:hypothetical protein